MTIRRNAGRLPALFIFSIFLAGLVSSCAEDTAAPTPGDPEPGVWVWQRPVTSRQQPSVHLSRRPKCRVRGGGRRDDYPHDRRREHVDQPRRATRALRSTTSLSPARGSGVAVGLTLGIVVRFHRRRDTWTRLSSGTDDRWRASFSSTRTPGSRWLGRDRSSGPPTPARPGPNRGRERNRTCAAFRSRARRPDGSRGNGLILSKRTDGGRTWTPQIERRHRSLQWGLASPTVNTARRWGRNGTIVANDGRRRDVDHRSRAGRPKELNQVYFHRREHGEWWGSPGDDSPHDQRRTNVDQPTERHHPETSATSGFWDADTASPWGSTGIILRTSGRRKKNWQSRIRARRSRSTTFSSRTRRPERNGGGRSGDDPQDDRRRGIVGTAMERKVGRSLRLWFSPTTTWRPRSGHNAES